MSDSVAHIIVVGAGLSGLMAATELQGFGAEVTVLDKGRGVGGRMASRRMQAPEGTAVLDHGAQFFTVRDPQFAQWVQQWESLEVVRKWAQGFGKEDGHPRYVGNPSMTAIAKHLAQDLEVRVQAKVEQIELRETCWSVTLDSAEVLTADGLVLAAPVPQSLALLEAGRVELSRSDRSHLGSLEYDPCLAVLVLPEAPVELPEPGALQIQGEPIAWIADNQRKGISPVSALTIHAGPRFSETHWETAPEVATRLVLEAAQERVAFIPREAQLHRWRFSQPRNPWRERAYRAECVRPLVFAGDAFGGPKVEGAALSGLAAAEQVLVALSTLT